MASQAFIEVVADTDGVEADLEREMTTIVREVERSLPEIDVDVDTSEARQSIADFQRDANGRLHDVRGRFVADGNAMADSSGRISNALSAIFPQAANASSAVGGLGVALGAVAASGVAAGAALAAIPLLFGGIGVVAAAQSKEVQKAFSGLKDHVVKEVTDMVGPIEKVLIDIAGVFRKTFDQIAPSLKTAFAQVAPLIGELGQSFADLLGAVVPAMAGLIGAATPAFNTITAGISGLGPAIAGFFEGIATGALGGADALEGIFTAINGLLPFIGQLLGALAQLGGPILLAVGNGLSQILTAFTPLIPIIGQIGTILAGILVPIIGTLTNLFVMLAPPIIAVANVLLSALAPILAQIPTILTPLLSLITGIAAIFIQIAAQVIGALLPALMPLIDAILQLAVALVPLVSSLLPVLLPLIKGLGAIITTVVPIIAALVGIVAKNLASAINNIAIPAIRLISALLRGDFSAATNAAKALVRGFATFFIDSFRNIYKGVSAAIKLVIAAVKKIPGQAKSALGAIGSYLYNSGKALLQGFISGIKSAGGAVASAVKGVLSKARNLLPFSPAKEGPFSGRGYTTYSGAALIQGLIEGIQGQEGELRRVLSQTLASTQMGFSPSITARNDRVNAFQAPAKALSHGLSFGGENLGTPNVTVMIGNQVVDKYVDVRIGANDRRRDRVTAQGIRR